MPSKTCRGSRPLEPERYGSTLGVGERNGRFRMPGTEVPHQRRQVRFICGRTGYSGLEQTTTARSSARTRRWNASAVRCKEYWERRYQRTPRISCAIRTDRAVILDQPSRRRPGSESASRRSARRSPGWRPPDLRRPVFGGGPRRQRTRVPPAGAVGRHREEPLPPDSLRLKYIKLDPAAGLEHPPA